MRKGGERTFIARGTSNTDSGRRPTVDDHMRIASLAKAYNGAVPLFALVDRGLLSLDDTIGEWLPGVLPFGDVVTVRPDAPSHRRGCRSTSVKGFANRVNADPLAYISPPELPEFVRDEPLDFFPGTEYRYCDSYKSSSA